MKDRKLNAVCTSILIVFAIVTSGLLFSGCQTTDTANGAPNEITEDDGGALPTFEWDTTKRFPRWRADSKITWFKTGAMQTVIDRAQSEQKPILCYVSRYERPGTYEFESILFDSEAWGDYLSENFINWEVNWWEDPVLAEYILAFTGRGAMAPMLLVLGVSSDTESDELRMVMAWYPTGITEFPSAVRYQSMEAVSEEGTEPMYNPEDPGMAEVLGRLTSYNWDELNPNPLDAMKPVIFDEEDSEGGFDPGEWVEMQNDSMRASMGPKATCPLYTSMYLAFDYLDRGGDITPLVECWESWREYRQNVSFEGLLLTEKAIDLAGDGFFIGPEMNLEFALLGKAIGATEAIDNETLVSRLYAMATYDRNTVGGGIPPYVDIRGTFSEDVDYISLFPAGMEESVEEFEDVEINEPVFGPRYYIWVNARALASWMRIDSSYPEFGELKPSSGDLRGHSHSDLYNVLADGVIRLADEKDSLTIVEQIYLLDMYNQLYQLTGDTAYLERGGKIAEGFTMENREEWFRLSSPKIYSDLALALYHYGWLFEEEEPREVAGWLSGKCLELAVGHVAITDVYYMAYVYSVVHSPCIHVGVVGGLGEDKSHELLNSALAGWDPRKIAQVLDPDRDGELIEKKWYTVMDEPVAFICIDDMCYPPVRESAELTETLGEVVTDIASESENGKSG